MIMGLIHDSLRKPVYVYAPTLRGWESSVHMPLLCQYKLRFGFLGK
jgi:hypothetical protein